MEEVVIPKLDTKEQLLVVIVGAAAAFFAEKAVNKGLTKVLLSRKS